MSRGKGAFGVLLTSALVAMAAMAYGQPARDTKAHKAGAVPAEDRPVPEAQPAKCTVRRDGDRV